jgi:hypothetical protein
MTPIPMRREVQGHGHSKTTILLPIATLGGAMQAISLVLMCSIEQLPFGKVPMLPTYATDIVEVCPWYNKVVETNLTLVP